MPHVFDDERLKEVEAGFSPIKAARFRQSTGLVFSRIICISASETLTGEVMTGEAVTGEVKEVKEEDSGDQRNKARIVEW